MGERSREGEKRGRLRWRDGVGKYDVKRGFVAELGSVYSRPLRKDSVFH